METLAGPQAVRARGRAERAGLTRDQVLDAALAFIDAHRIEALTMRGLAAHLGVTPMALYNHVRDKQDLLQGVAAKLLAEADFVNADPDWRERIRFAFRQLRTICLTHAGAARVMEEIDLAPPSVFTLLEVTLAALDEIGMPTAEAMRAYALLMNFTLGQVSYELRGPFRALDPHIAGRRQNLSEAGLPHAAQAARLEHWNFDRAFEFGLSVILGGLERWEQGNDRRSRVGKGE
jgi:TetR/AcrR family tetracycline transcriptional repressor